MKFKSDLYEFIAPVVVDEGRFFIDDMFQRKFGTAGPDKTNHLIAFYQCENKQFIPVSYLSFLPYKNVLLVGGGMTDGQAIATMTDTQKKLISENDGLLYFMLRHGFELFANQCDAYFGHVNNPRAYEIDIKAGFVPTKYEYLVAHFHKNLSNWKKNSLTKMVHKIGPF